MRGDPGLWVVAALIGSSIAGGIGVGGLIRQSPVLSDDAAAYAALGAPKLERAYAVWTRAHEARGGDHSVELELSYTKALSVAFSRARGKAEVDLLYGRVEVDVVDLPEGDFDVWIVDNLPEPGASLRPEPSDALLRVGRLLRTGQRARLIRELGPDAFAELQVDLVVIAPATRGPEQGLLYGAPSLFQRIYSATRDTRALEGSDYAPGAEPAGLEYGISVAGQAITVERDVLFDTLAAQGAELFMREPFGGNGRTCATCHPLSRNTQLSASDIAALPDDDPLFVAEFVPALNFSASGPKFEVPMLMRGAALITENQDGMDDLANKFSLRGIPRTPGLATSLDPTPALREAAAAAVVQHFTQRLDRQPGVDFRLPTDLELDALAAFQLALGRETDPALPIAFRSPVVMRGQQIFMAPSSRCNSCHGNASGTIASGTGRTFNTGVEDQPDRPTELILQSEGIDLTPDVPYNLFPRDNGLGAVGNPTSGIESGAFHTPPLVEAADTGPYFHDNHVRTIEGAVAFYNSDAFASSPAGNPRINLQATQIEAVAAFLRALNTLENIRASRELAATVAALAAKQRTRSGPALLSQAAQEIEDAIRVLIGADLHPDAVADLRAALALIPPDPRANDLQAENLGAITALLDQARARLVF
jgi:hypothetical protein